MQLIITITFIFPHQKVEESRGEGGYAMPSYLCTCIGWLVTRGIGCGHCCLSSSVNPWMIRSRAASLNPKPVASSANEPTLVDIFRSVGQVKGKYV